MKWKKESLRALLICSARKEGRVDCAGVLKVEVGLMMTAMSAVGTGQSLRILVTGLLEISIVLRLIFVLAV